MGISEILVSGLGLLPALVCEEEDSLGAGAGAFICVSSILLRGPLLQFTLLHERMLQFTFLQGLLLHFILLH